METAEHREPYESRGSRTDLGAPRGATPLGDSTNPTFGALASHYIARECARLARGNEIEGVIRRYLLEPWGERPVAELRRRDLIKLIDPVVESGRTQAAHKLNEVALRIIS
jgi:hypothetical protein